MACTIRAWIVFLFRALQRVLIMQDMWREVFLRFQNKHLPDKFFILLNIFEFISYYLILYKKYH